MDGRRPPDERRPTRRHAEEGFPDEREMDRPRHMADRFNDGGRDPRHMDERERHPDDEDERDRHGDPRHRDERDRHGDFRHGDPRHMDERFVDERDRHGDPRHMEERDRHGDPRHMDERDRHGDPRHMEERDRHGDPRHMDERDRHGDPRHMDERDRHGDPRHMDERDRHGDPRHMDEGDRHGDPRHMDEEFMDEREMEMERDREARRGAHRDERHWNGGNNMDGIHPEGRAPVDVRFMDERYRDGRHMEGGHPDERFMEHEDMEMRHREGGHPGMPGMHAYGENGMYEAEYGEEPVYNIIPVQDTLHPHPALQFPEVRAAISALRAIGGLREPEGAFEKGLAGMDMMDWLGLTFGFQEDNVKNQREHIVLLLANAQMRLQPPPDPIDTLKLEVVRTLRKKMTKNYLSWCHFLHIPSSIHKLEGRHHEVNEQKELLYTALYFLIWGEAANLRFMPECLCFFFHNMAAELNRILDRTIDTDGQYVRAATEGPHGFLMKAVKPIYDVVKDEAEASRKGGAPHSAWRNYDDMNEYFWSKRCLTQLLWPMSMSCNYLVPPAKGRGKISRQKVGKTGFVEQRSFWNVYRSFDRLWAAQILVLQLMIIVAFRARRGTRGDRMPWTVLGHRDAQAQALSIFITWAGLRVLQAFLDFGMQYSLITMGTLRVGLRMVLKLLVACVWVVLFSVYYARMWSKRDEDGGWTTAALSRLYTYLGFAAVFIIPETLALLLFIIPFIRNFVERSDLRIFRPLTWWFQSNNFVGRGLREGFFDNLKYTLFWAAIIIIKVAFSYFLQILPLVRPTRTTLRIREGQINYRWHEFFRGANRTALLCMWSPVILIYFMDFQIWYSVVSAVVGALGGLLGHLGEIRNAEQMRSRFQFFPAAVVFNLMPEEGLLKQRMFYNWWGRVKNAVRRFKLRFGVREKKSNAVNEVGKFKIIWNEIIATFREEDIIGDYEMVLLQMPAVGWNITVTQWPLILLSNEIRIALRYCDPEHHRWYYSDRWLWRKIARNEYRRCAVIETYESLTHILSRIIKQDNDDRHIFPVIFQEIDNAIQQGRFIKTFRLQCLPQVHECLTKFIGVLMKRAEPNDIVALQNLIGSLQNLYEVLVRDFPKDQSTKTRFHELASRKLLFVDAVELPDVKDEKFFAQLMRLHTALSTRTAFLNVPKSLEARRRMAFFSNSIFMTMPRAPQVEKMLAFSVLTPYYAEDVMYNKSQLTKGNEDGVTTLEYLQKVFPEDWDYFRERMAKIGIDSDKKMWEHEDGLQIRLWASYRGQTLVRTVRGMMYNARALQKLAFLDLASELDVEGHKELISRNQSMEIVTVGKSRHSSFGLGRSGRSFRTELYTGHQEDQDRATAAMKFTYVVACQKYGEQKAKKEKAADDVLYLMKTFEALRIAYFDQTGGDWEEKKYYSVLIKYDHKLQQEVELYRIRLPGPLILGEGKPENQNHALIFTRGDAIQTIDMNQENYYEEALKMRNLLQEFDKYYGIRKPTILGVREHVFTGTVSSLASFMSAQEMSFVTLGQRVLANPLKVRMHYGHPDVFDRLWFLTRGGISKASKVINISEDIYAGFNCTLRGGTVTHHEYIQVGKGRDVGLNQIAMFEAKVASGNGEQMLSRDIYRLGHRLDFFRMMSVYYTTVGFFVNNVIIVLTVYAFLWGRCYLAVSGIEESISGKSKSNTALTAALNQQFLVQIGILTALPLIVENSLEKGFLRAIWEFLTMQLQLASVFFTFSLGTRAHFFGRTILHGGAAYRATGRGFVVRHESFTTNYQLYARSHFVKGIEVILLLIIYQAYGASKSTLVYILTTVSCWFLGITWILAPFLFNPSGFDWLKSVDDFDEFMNWIWYQGGVFVKGTDSWLKWWDEEQDHFKSTGFWGKVMEIVLDLRFFFFQYGIVYRLKIASGSSSILVYLLSWVYIFFAGLFHLVLAVTADRYGAKQQLRYRSIQALMVLALLLAIVMLFVFTNFSIWDVFTSLLAFIPTGWGILSILITLRRPFLENTPVWKLVTEAARLYELLMGLFVMAPVVFLSWLPGVQAMQTRILFNEAFSRGLQLAKIIEGKRSSYN